MARPKPDLFFHSVHLLLCAHYVQSMVLWGKDTRPCLQEASILVKETDKQTSKLMNKTVMMGL